MPTVPDTIGPYQVLRPIAQGGMAEVFEVQDPGSGERLALKLLVETKASVRRFNREFEALTRLNHPGIVRVFRYGYHGRQPWITMELLDGRPLQAHVKRLGPPGTRARTEEVIRVGFFLANALQYIHDRGLVHRDLKSANVQVLGDGRVKVIDFGTAHLAHPLERITQEGDFVGTFSYAAPEQIVGQKVDHRADLYALGVLLYRLSTGRRPFKHKDPRKVAQMHLTQTARPPKELVRDLPTALQDVILWLMEKKKAARPRSADEVAKALEDLAGRPLGLPGRGIALYDQRPIGRGPETRVVWRHLRSHPSAEAVLVTGGDGTERKRFASWLVDGADKRGWRGLVVDPDLGPGGALDALAASFRVLVKDDDESTARQIRDLLTAGTEGHGHGDLGEVLQATTPGVARTLQRRAEPTLFVLQEFHDFGVQARHAVRSFVGAVVRDGAPVSFLLTASRPMPPAVRTILDLLADHHEMPLEPLDVRRTALAVGELLHRRPPPPEAARRIHEESAGRPTLIEAVVRRMVAHGRLEVRSDDANRVDWTPPEHDDDGGLDATLEAEIDARLQRLPSLGRRVLEALWVAGGEAHRRVLERALGWPTDDLLLLLEHLDGAGVVLREVGSARTDVVVRPADPLLMEAVGRAIKPARLRAVQRLVVDVLPTQPLKPALVRALLGVGRMDQALDLGVRCAGQLGAQGKHGQALQLLDALRTAAEHPGLSKTLRAKFFLLYGRTVRSVRPMDPASVRALHQADALVHRDRSKARVQFAYAELQGAIGHYQNYERYLGRAWKLLLSGRPVPLAADVALHHADIAVQRAELKTARTWYERAVKAAEAARAGALEDRGRAGLAWIAYARGDLARAEERLDRVVTRQADGGDPVTHWRALAAWGHAVRQQGRFSEVFDRLEPQIVAAREGPSPPSFIRLLMASATCELDLGRLGRAQEVMDEALSTMGQGERLHLRLEARLLQGRIQLASGLYGRGAYLLQEVANQADLAGLELLKEQARGFLAEAQWALGDREEALQLYREVLIALARSKHVVALGDAVVSRARALRGREDPSRGGFRLVDALLDKPEFRLLYIEHLLAEMRWHRAQGHGPRTAQVLRAAQAALSRLAARQNRIEEAAMRVHPWTKEVRQAMA